MTATTDHNSLVNSVSQAIAKEFIKNGIVVYTGEQMGGVREHVELMVSQILAKHFALKTSQSMDQMFEDFYGKPEPSVAATNKELAEDEADMAELAAEYDTGPSGE